jgi:hypothetical protein
MGRLDRSSYGHSFTRGSPGARTLSPTLPALTATSPSCCRRFCLLLRSMRSPSEHVKHLVSLASGRAWSESMSLTVHEGRLPVKRRASSGTRRLAADAAARCSEGERRRRPSFAGTTDVVSTLGLALDRASMILGGAGLNRINSASASRRLGGSDAPRHLEQLLRHRPL